MYSSRIKDFLGKAEMVSPKRVLLALGFILLVCAQVYFETREPFGEHITGAIIWNAVHKLEIVNYDNVWSALPYLFGGSLLWLWLGNYQWNEPPHTGELGKAKNIHWAHIFPQLIIITAIYAYLIFRLTQHHITNLEPFLWILSLTWLTYLIWKWDKQKNTDLSFDFDASDLTSILILLFIGIAIGAFALTDLPIQIIRDEDPFWEASRIIALGEYKASFFDIGVFTFPLSTSIFQSWVMRIFGATFWSWRFSSVLAGVATVVPLYLLVRSWFGQRVAFTAGLMMLVNPYFLSFSRFGYNNIQSLLPVTLAIYLWEKGIRKNSIFYLWLGGLAAGLGYYSFFAAWIGAVTIGLSIFYLWFRKQISHKQVWISLAILIIAFTLMAAPRIALAAGSGRSEALVYKIFEVSFINVTYGRHYYADSELIGVAPLIEIGEHHELFFHPRVYWELITRGTIRTFLALVDPYIATEHFLVSGFAGIITPIFFVIGLALALKNWKQYRIGLLLLWPFGGLLFLSILNAIPPRQTHLVAIIPVLALFSALGLISTVEQIIQQDSVRKYISSLVLIAIIFFSLQTFFVKLPKIYPASFEDYSAWIAMRADKPITIIYAGSTEEPHRIQYLVNVMMIPNEYFAIPTQITAQEAGKYADTPTLIFFEGKDENIVGSMQELGFHNYTAYKNNGTFGYAFTNTSINLTPNTSLYAELILLLKSPASVLLGLLLAALGVHIVRERHIRPAYQLNGNP